MRKYLLVFFLVITTPALACWNAFEPCADETLPMSDDTFMVSARGARFIFGDGPNVAVMESAASGCAQRGFPQFIISAAQGGNEYYLNNNRPTATTDAVVKCVRTGGLSVRKYLRQD